jgi:glycogen debranching enzyme
MFMAAAIRFSCATIGQAYDPKTGEEPGRGIHEFDDVEQRGLSTRYNATEVSLLLLITAAVYWQKTQDATIIKAERRALTAAVYYLLAHLQEGLFFEDPGRCGATHYALRATYWKDAGLPGRMDPDYPVVYTLVQAQAVAALRAAALLREPLGIQEDVEKIAEKAIDRLVTDLWDEATNYPLIGMDQTGKISGISSDGLHMLAYLREGDILKERLAGITAGASRLITPYGYRTYAPEQPEYSPSNYHLGSIWPYEQFFITKGALINHQPGILEGSLRIVRALEKLGFPELVCWDGEKLTGGGCDLQLWSAAYPLGIYALLLKPEEGANVRLF